MLFDPDKYHVPHAILGVCINHWNNNTIYCFLINYTHIVLEKAKEGGGRSEGKG